MKIRAHVLVEGRVQGVYFRSYLLEEAKRLKVTGWVRNLIDGRVEMILEGNREDIQSIVNWCHSGPPSARVSEVKVDWEPYTGKYSTFFISY